MKNWEDDDDSEYCSSRQDWLDAASVADVIGLQVDEGEAPHAAARQRLGGPGADTANADNNDLGLPEPLAAGVSVTRQVQESMKTGHWDNTGKEVSRVAGGWLGAAAAGALVGSASGSIVPVLGNVTGFLVGAAAGAVGYWLGSRGGEAAYQAAAH